MPALAFRTDREDCPMPAVPAIELGLIDECLIPPAPEPIWSSPPPPVLPPLPFIGCPTFEVSPTVEVVDNLDEPEFDASVDYADEDNCFPHLNLNLRLPRVLTSGEGLAGVSTRKIGSGSLVGDVRAQIHGNRLILTIVKADPMTC